MTGRGSSGSPPPAPREATPQEASLAGILIGGTFGLIGIAAVATPPFADKLRQDALAWGAAAGGVAVVCFALSLFFGGRGMFQVTPGPGNAFDRQARFGLLGIACLCVAALIFAFGPKQSDDTGKRLEALEAELVGLKAADAAMRQRLDRLEPPPTAVAPRTPAAPDPNACGSAPTSPGRSGAETGAARR